ncbi:MULTISPECIES: glycosyltransferase family 4 protein [Maribacter]|nr:glycosyltransferase family 4 protein [Maribacter sp. PR66]MDC6405683.1 glycosyltransferase family 4 protein [Maribacter sp. PR66]
MKIDFVIGSLYAGGAERVVSTLANHFAEKGHSVRVITFRGGDHYSLHPSVKRIHGTSKLIFFNYTVLRAFLFLLKFYFKRKNRPDIISSHIDLMGFATIPVSRIYGIKLTVSEHFNHFNRKLTIQKKILWNFLYKFPETLTVLTKFDLPYFKPKTKNVEVILNPSSFVPITDLNRSRNRTILAVGDLNRFEHKGFDNLLDIAEEVLTSQPDWNLKIVGQGEYGMNILMEKINTSPIKKQIIFTGYRNDVKELMANSEIFILSSRHEGLPLVLIEAMSQGMACISYDCISGPSEIIDSGINGLLIDNQNKEEMIENLKNLIVDDKLRNKLRQNSIKSLDRFSIDNIGNQWEDLFKKIVYN